MNDRAEQAFRDAFAEHGAEDIEPVRPPRRRLDARWALAAGVAVVALAVPGALLLGGRDADSETPEVAEPAQPADSASPGTPIPVAHLSGLEAPEDGWKWVSRRDVAVQVPESWPYSSYSWMPWCLNSAVEPAMPEGPYVDSPEGVIPYIGCPEVGPEYVRMHVGFGEPSPADTAVKTSADGAAVYVVMEAEPTTEEEALADQILSTATTFERDHAGCTPVGPFTSVEDRPEPWDIGAAEGVSQVGVCRYSPYPEEGEPNLSGSLVIEGEGAVGLVEGIAAAPEGVSGDPAGCMEGFDERGGVVLRVADASGVHDVYLRVDGCRNLGFDDGVTQRQLTDECRTVFREAPVTLDGVGWEAGEMCFPEPAPASPTAEASGHPGEIEFSRPPGFDPPITRPTEPPEER